MRTLVRTYCRSSEEEDEDGGGRDNPWSATDEDFACGPRRGSPRGSSQNSQGRAIDRWFWSAYVLCSSQHLDSMQLALEQINLIRRLVNKHQENMVLVTTAEVL
ncbi:uncharacterized protein [Anoplolepis gracilipes]|uniref:uncharacterized protein n=1 Tax=Anoplolepis gracilipes TaxID=354296 RepID=UPI003BA250F3